MNLLNHLTTAQQINVRNAIQSNPGCTIVVNWSDPVWVEKTWGRDLTRDIRIELFQLHSAAKRRVAESEGAFIPNITTEEGGE